MEYASGGSVWSLVTKFNSLDERLIKTYTKQILEGVLALHSEGIIHGFTNKPFKINNMNRNLKSSNVLIDANGIIKLSDIASLNHIKYLVIENMKENQKQILNSSVYWTAPEVIETDSTLK